MRLHSLHIWIFMAFRFIRRHKRKTVATGSFIILGTAILVFLHALTVGINDTMVLNTTRIHYGHAFLELPASFNGPENIARKFSMQKGVQNALLRYRFSSLVSHHADHAPVNFYAVDPEIEANVTAISKRIISGTYPSPHKNEILLGSKTAERLNAGQGDIVSVLESSGVYLGEFTISGVYETEIPHFDNTIGYMPINVLTGPARFKSVPELAIFFSTANRLRKRIEQLSANLPGNLSIQSWEEMMPDLIQLIQMNEIAMQILIIFIFVLVGFGISNSFVLTIVERYREFGILKAMGVTPKELVGLIFLESFIVCFAAALIGLGVGWLLTHVIAWQGIDFSGLTSHNRYFIVSGVVRPRATWSSIYWPGLMSIIVAAVSSYLPTRIAARKATTETLRFS